MILQEVAKKVTEEGVEKALQTIYFQNAEFNKKAYMELLERLKQTEPNLTEDNMTIHVEYTKDFGSEESIWTSSYSMNKRFNRKFLLVFASTEEIAGANIIEDELSNHEEYIAHVLREMLYQHESEEEESEFHAEDKERRSLEEPEYCSVKEILDSMEDDTYED